MKQRSIRLRSLVVLVAVAAIALSALIYRQRAREFQRVAAEEAEKAASATANARSTRLVFAQAGDHFDPALDFPRTIRDQERLAAYHTKRGEQIQRCARYPWLSRPQSDPFVSDGSVIPGKRAILIPRRRRP